MTLEMRELLAHPIGPLVRTCREGGALTDGERAAVEASGLLDVIEGRPCWACVHDERGRERWVRGVVAGGIRSRYCGRQVRQYEGHDVAPCDPWLETVAVHLDGESEARDVAVERVRAEVVHPHDPIVRLDALRGHVRGPDEMMDARLDWIVVGGESGPGARPFDIVWARSVITQCREAGVACFVKQLGAHPVNGERSAIYDRHGLVAPGLAHEEAEEYAPRYDEGRIVRPAPVRIRDRKGGAMSEWPKDLRVREWPSRLAV